MNLLDLMPLPPFARRSRASRNTWMRPEYREKQSTSQSRAHQQREANLIEASRRPEVKQKRRESIKRAWAQMDPDKRKRHAINSKKAWTPERRKRISEFMRQRRANERKEAL